ncbi:MAG TPA: hypothetical protein VN815_09825 [Steroidobacteraceae bacterium]|nr:hypothetical protein [Steroidobacteraceae bacterium]
MDRKHVAVYFSLDQPAENAAPLGILENRFATLFEVRRLFWPRFENFADPKKFDQGVAGFLGNILFENFRVFLELIPRWTESPVRVAHRRTADSESFLDAKFLSGIDTLIVISFDSLRTQQQAQTQETAAVRDFLKDPDHLIFVCPHHDIGNLDGVSPDQWLSRQEAEFHHHGDPAIPPQQRFGGFAASLLQGLGLQVRNRFGLHPAKAANGEPAPLVITAQFDRHKLLNGVTTFNLHPHLPHFEIGSESADRIEVLAQQEIDLDAPAHPFVQAGNHRFNALLQTTPDFSPGSLLICDATTWSSTAGGLESLQRFWRNVAQR